MMHVSGRVTVEPEPVLSGVARSSGIVRRAVPRVTIAGVPVWSVSWHVKNPDYCGNEVLNMSCHRRTPEGWLGSAN